MISSRSGDERKFSQRRRSVLVLRKDDDEFYYGNACLNIFTSKCDDTYIGWPCDCLRLTTGSLLKRSGYRNEYFWVNICRDQYWSKVFAWSGTYMHRTKCAQNNKPNNSILWRKKNTDLLTWTKILAYFNLRLKITELHLEYHNVCM